MDNPSVTFGDSSPYTGAPRAVDIMHAAVHGIVVKWAANAACLYFKSDLSKNENNKNILSERNN
jgi:hypothetical protein